MKIAESIITDALRYYFFPKKGARSGFAFLVHPRDLSDVHKVIPVSKFLPDKVLRFLLRRFFAFTVGKIKANHSENIVITIPLTGQEMLRHETLAIRMIRKAFVLAQRRGVKMVGLGAYTSSVTKGGEALADLKEKGVCITTGNTLTALISFRHLKLFLKSADKHVKISDLVCAVIGATGSVGRGFMELAVDEPEFSELILVGRTPERLQKLKKELEERGLLGKKKITITNFIPDIVRADVVFVATSARSMIIKPEYIKENGVIYDVTQPRNVPKEITEARPDIAVIDGGVIETPDIDYPNIFGLEPHFAFACLAETLMLSLSNIDREFLGLVSKKDIDLISSLLDEQNFKLAPFMSFGKKML